MIADKKEFFGGIGLMALFLIVLTVIFLPLFNGQNGLNYLDNLFNSISKGSAYYIPAISEEVAQKAGKPVTVTLTYETALQARQSALLFRESGAAATVSDTDVSVNGDFGKILAGSLKDADTLFMNNGEALQARYGIEPRQVLYNWWISLKSMQKALNKQERFADAKTVHTVITRAVECSYNYYQIEPEHITDRMGTVIFALVFYVIYTLWYGYAILFIFEGWGLQISH